MSSPPFSPSEEASWQEKVRRRELYRSAISLAHVAEHLQITEDFPSGTPNFLAKLIFETANLLARGLESTAPAQDLEQINTVLGIITTHLRYVERARVAQTPWSIVQSAEKLFKLATTSKSHFILRPIWAYNYSIIGEFLSSYRRFISPWPWFSHDDWEKQIGLKKNDSIYCISFPRIERTNCLLHANWGHEVGHILVAKWVDTDFGATWAPDELGIKEKIEDDIKRDPPPVDPLFKAIAIQRVVANQMRATMEAAKQGFVELLCDLIGVHIFGPSSLAATIEFASRFALDVSPLQSFNYPPWRYRLRKMLQHCEQDLIDNPEIGYPDKTIKPFIEWLNMGQRLTGNFGDEKVIGSNNVTKFAYKFISDHWDEAAKKVISMLPGELAQPYRLSEHYANISKMVELLDRGVPPNEISHLSNQPATFQDILSAGWAFKMDQIAKKPSWGSPDEYNLLFRLILKACESSHVHSEWGERIIKEEI